MNVHRARAAWGVSIAVLLGLGWWRYADERSSHDSKMPEEFSTILANWQKSTRESFPSDGFHRGPLKFPSDHAAHSGTPAENWEVLMSLESGGRHFVARVAMDRLGVAAEPSQRASRWAAHQFFRSVVSVADPIEGRVLPFERYARSALGLSGSAIDPARVWVGASRLDWSQRAGLGEILLVTVHESGLSMELRLSPSKPSISPEHLVPANARWQGYMWPTCDVSGTLLIQGQTFSVRGGGWYTHAWGQFPPVGGQLAFNRWTIVLDDGRELVLLQTRRRDGSGVPFVQGIWITRDGSAESLDSGTLELRPVEYDGAHPVQWHLSVPAIALDLRVFPLVRGQTRERISEKWNGAIGVEDVNTGGQFSGWGFVELDGY